MKIPANLIAETLVLKEFKDFLNIPWDKAPFLVLTESKKDIWMFYNGLTDIRSISIENFHKVIGYGSLRWRNIFGWLTRYLDRCRGLEERYRIRAIEDAFKIPVPDTWNFSKISDLVYELRDVSAHYPSVSAKTFGDKIYFTELSEDGSSSSRYERVWGATFVQPVPTADLSNKPGAKAFGSGDKTINEKGEIVFTNPSSV